MTGLERRCRALLLAYPASYRRDRGEEIIGTLLEATPPGQAWPSPRDARALIAGGLGARVAQNRGLSTAENVRLAVLLGAAVYLSYQAAALFVLALEDRGAHWPSWTRGAYWWPNLTTALLLLVTVVAAWLTPRRVVLGVTAAAAAAVVWFAVAEASAMRAVPVLAVRSAANTLTELLPLALIAVLSGRHQRPPRSWLLLVGLFALGPLVTALMAALDPRLATAAHLIVLLYLLPVAVIVAWAILDARALLGLATAVGLLALAPMPQENYSFVDGWSTVADLWPVLVVAVALAAPGIWRLRRRAAS